MHEEVTAAVVLADPVLDGTREEVRARSCAREEVRARRWARGAVREEVARGAVREEVTAAVVLPDLARCVAQQQHHRRRRRPRRSEIVHSMWSRKSSPQSRSMSITAAVVLLGV